MRFTINLVIWLAVLGLATTYGQETFLSKSVSSTNQKEGSGDAELGGKSVGTQDEGGSAKEESGEEDGPSKIGEERSLFFSKTTKKHGGASGGSSSYSASSHGSNGEGRGHGGSSSSYTKTKTTTYGRRGLFDFSGSQEEASGRSHSRASRTSNSGSSEEGNHHVSKSTYTKKTTYKGSIFDFADDTSDSGSKEVVSKTITKKIIKNNGDGGGRARIISDGGRSSSSSSTTTVIKKEDGGERALYVPKEKSEEEVEERFRIAKFFDSQHGRIIMNSEKDRIPACSDYLPKDACQALKPLCQVSDTARAIRYLRERSDYILYLSKDLQKHMTYVKGSVNNPKQEHSVKLLKNLEEISQLLPSVKKTAPLIRLILDEDSEDELERIVNAHLSYKQECSAHKQMCYKTHVPAHKRQKACALYDDICCCDNYKFHRYYESIVAAEKRVECKEAKAMRKATRRLVESSCAATCGTCPTRFRVKEYAENVRHAFNCDHLKIPRGHDLQVHFEQAPDHQLRSHHVSIRHDKSSESEEFVMDQAIRHHSRDPVFDPEPEPKKTKKCKKPTVSDSAEFSHYPSHQEDHSSEYDSGEEEEDHSNVYHGGEPVIHEEHAIYEEHPIEERVVHEVEPIPDFEQAPQRPAGNPYFYGF